MNNLQHSLSFEVVFETSLDDFTFKVPFMLNLLLDPEPSGVDFSLHYDQHDSK